MQNYKIVLEYVGARYNGWQKQGNTQNTIQTKVENVLFRLVKNDVEVFGSGRTDAGVHAKYQVANFKLENEFDCQFLKNYLNKYLPADIKVNQIEKVNDRFHARLNAKSKTYEYKIANEEKPSVFDYKFCAFVEQKLDLDKMIKASQHFIGKHDFKAFCSNKRYKKSTVREIFSINIQENKDVISIKICGNGFLHNMVRIMVGTLVEVGIGKLDVNDILSILETTDRQKAGYTMPPQGLTLIDVKY